ncbi:MAG: DinB family protein [Chitinophagaceae bacterium]
MKRSDIHTVPSHFGAYINQVEDIELNHALAKSMQQLNDLDIVQLKALGNSVYAPGKWTIPQILQHIIDCERVFAYRALRLSRNDKTPLAGFDQELFIKNINPVERDLDGLIKELKVVKQSSILFYQSLNDEMLLRTGLCSNIEMMPLSLGFTIVGHQMHHLKIIEERYLPLLSKS